MKTKQDRPDHQTHTFDPGDYVCLADYHGNQCTPWRMIPEDYRLTFDSPGVGDFYLGVRDPRTFKMLWWGSFGNKPSFWLGAGSQLHVNFDPLGERSVQVAEPAKPGWLRRLFGGAA